MIYTICRLHFAAVHGCVKWVVPVHAKLSQILEKHIYNSLLCTQLTHLTCYVNVFTFVLHLNLHLEDWSTKTLILYVPSNVFTTCVTDCLYICTYIVCTFCTFENFCDRPWNCVGIVCTDGALELRQKYRNHSRTSVTVVFMTEYNLPINWWGWRKERVLRFGIVPFKPIYKQRSIM